MSEEQKKVVLLVEDEPALAEAIKLKLEKQGVEVWHVISGDDALKLLETKRPNLVWLDILLPGKNGLEVLRIIRDSAQLKDLPVVIVSVSAGGEKIKQAFSMNVLDYIVKSEYKIDEIVQKIVNMIGHLQ